MKNAIYVHGLGSGAASTTIKFVRKVFPDYDWRALEVNEDPVESVNIINQAIARLTPTFLMGTSLGGLYLMYADMTPCEDGTVRFLFNPACDIGRIIRETLGFGTKKYFVPRQDGIQEYELNEVVCARFDSFIDGNQPTSGKGCDYAMFSINDEIIGRNGVNNNQCICFNAGYRILIDWEGGHRLRKATLRLAWNHLSRNSNAKYRIGDRVLFKTNEPAIHFSKLQGDGHLLDYATRKKEEFIGVISDCHPESVPQLYFARTLHPLDSFFCALVKETDIIRLATCDDVRRLIGLRIPETPEGIAKALSEEELK